MAARRPFWKRHRWKSIGFCLWPPSTCIWSLKLKFQSKLDLCSGNHVVYRQTDGQTDRRTRWIQYTPPPTSLGGGIMISPLTPFNPLRPRHNGRQVADGNFKSVFLYKNIRSLTRISLNGLALNRQQVIVWGNDDQVYWHIYASLRLDALSGPLWILWYFWYTLNRFVWKWVR